MTERTVVLADLFEKLSTIAGRIFAQRILSSAVMACCYVSRRLVECIRLNKGSKAKPLLLLIFAGQPLGLEEYSQVLLCR